MFRSFSTLLLIAFTSLSCFAQKKFERSGLSFTIPNNWEMGPEQEDLDGSFRVFCSDSKSEVETVAFYVLKNSMSVEEFLRLSISDLKSNNGSYEVTSSGDIIKTSIGKIKECKMITFKMKSVEKPSISGSIYGYKFGDKLLSITVYQTPNVKPSANLILIKNSISIK